MWVYEADARREIGDHAGAREVLVQAQTSIDTLHDDYARAEALVSLALLDSLDGRPNDGAERYAAAKGYRLIRCHGRLALARAYTVAGNPVEARTWAVRALGGYRSIGNPLGEARSLELLARNPTVEPVVATRLAGAAAELYFRMGIPVGTLDQPGEGDRALLR